jgi:hypothetical protein
MFSEGCPAPREADGRRGGRGFFFAGGRAGSNERLLKEYGVRRLLKEYDRS